ncbi:MAG: thioredoxin-disulfide reductase [candidate division KSB1 bacterium]|nr:thioredoxin-disulfide reductase [candidate division KSB1 bacterium]
MSNDVNKVVIIGAGPAGYTAGIYTARAELDPIVFAGPEPGGQLTMTTEVENFPGFANGIQGPELMEEMRKQAERFGAKIKYETVNKVDFSQRPFRIWADSGEYQAHAVIIASGASAKLLGLESEKKLIGRGVSTCATCDGYFFRGQEIAIVGGGDSAMEEALFLTKFATKVTVIHRRDQLRASKIMQERAFKNEKIEFKWNSVVKDVKDVEAGKVTGVVLENVKTGEISELPVSGLFIAIGHKPNTDILRGQVEMDEAGYIITKERTQTSVEGVFAAGDVADHVYRQAITAAGMGCQAALDAERYLSFLE